MSSSEKINDFYRLIRGDQSHMPHYSILAIDQTRGMEALKEMFPEGKCDEMNFVLFGTSGGHGCVGNVDELFTEGNQTDEDLESGVDKITVLVIQPRLVCLRYGHIVVKPDDIPFLQALRDSSREAMRAIA